MAKNNNECYLRILFPIKMALPIEKCDFQNFNREVFHVLLKFLEIIKTEVGPKKMIA